MVTRLRLPLLQNATRYFQFRLPIPIILILFYGVLCLMGWSPLNVHILKAFVFLTESSLDQLCHQFRNQTLLTTPSTEGRNNTLTVQDIRDHRNDLNEVLRKNFGLIKTTHKETAPHLDSKSIYQNANNARKENESDLIDYTQSTTKLKVVNSYQPPIIEAESSQNVIDTLKKRRSRDRFQQSKQPQSLLLTQFEERTSPEYVKMHKSIPLLKGLKSSNESQHQIKRFKHAPFWEVFAFATLSDLNKKSFHLGRSTKLSRETECKMISQHKESIEFSPKSLTDVEFFLEGRPQILRDWLIILTFGISVWMFGSTIANAVYQLESVGPNVCAVFGPASFLCSLFCLLLPTHQIIKFLGISFLGMSFHLVYRTAMGICLSSKTKRGAIASILFLSTAADMSSIVPLASTLYSLKYGLIGSQLRNFLLKLSIGISCLAAALLIGMVPNCHLIIDGKRDHLVADLNQTIIDLEVDNEISPFLDSRNVTTQPDIRFRFEGDNGRNCILEYVPKPQESRSMQLYQQQKRIGQMQIAMGSNEWILELFNALATTYIVCWSSQSLRMRIFPNGTSFFDIFSFLICLSWIPGLCLILIWRHSGFLTLRRIQLITIIISLIFFAFFTGPTDMIAIFFFLTTRTASFGSIDLAIKSLEEWYIENGRYPYRKVPTSGLIPFIHLLMIPYSDILFHLVHQKEQSLNQHSTHSRANGNFAADKIKTSHNQFLYHLKNLSQSQINTKIILQMNVIWAGVGVLVLFLSLIFESWISKTFKYEYAEVVQQHRHFWKLEQNFDAADEA